MADLITLSEVNAVIERCRSFGVHQLTLQKFGAWQEP